MPEPSWFRYYAKMPIWAQNAACSIGGWKLRHQRYRRTFWDALEFLCQSQWWSLQQQQAYQDERLREVIRHAYEHVPYYTEVFRARKLTPDDIRTREDLVKLPILTKQIIRQRGEDMFSRGLQRSRMMPGHTGGTTGTALKLMSEPETLQWQWAIWWRHHRRFGVDVHEPYINFAGRSVVPLTDRRPPFWRRNYGLNQTFVSVHHMCQETMPALVDYLQTRKVAYYSGYPSGIYMLATYLLEKGIHLRHPPRVVFTGAESVLPHQRWAIETALDAPIGDQWGSGEMVANISECRKHVYHVDMEHGIIEFEPSPALPPSQRRIICTGLHNLAMPLIRYEIGDIATVGDQTCTCGRQAPTVQRIDGRIEAYIVTPDGRQLGRLDHLFKDSLSIREAQMIQDRLDHVLVKVVKAPAYAEADETKLLSDMRAYMGSAIDIEIQYVEEIPREANGKFRQVISHVFRDKYASLTETGSAASGK